METGFNIIELFEFGQVFFAFIIIVYMYKHSIDRTVQALYFLTALLFMGLKLRFIPYELGGDFDRFLWGSYNVLYNMCMLFLIIDLGIYVRNNKSNNRLK